ncbi:hypothetical protein Hanom_Chr03g00262001 [Helianthus anomalus]
MRTDIGSCRYGCFTSHCLTTIRRDKHPVQMFRPESLTQSQYQNHSQILNPDTLQVLDNSATLFL